MKKVLLFLSVLVFTACGGGGGSSDNGDGGGGGGGGNADFYYRNGAIVPGTSLSILGPPDGHNPVLDVSVNPPAPYRVGEVTRVDAYANGADANAISTIHDGHLYMTIPLVNPSWFQPLSDLFEGECSGVPNVNYAMINFVTRDDGLYLIKVAIKDDTLLWWYMLTYVDADADVTCLYTDHAGDIIDVKLSLKTGWNEIKMSDVENPSTSGVEEFWGINFD